MKKDARPELPSIGRSFEMYEASARPGRLVTVNGGKGDGHRLSAGDPYLLYIYIAHHAIDQLLIMAKSCTVTCSTAPASQGYR